MVLFGYASCTITDILMMKRPLLLSLYKEYRGRGIGTEMMKEMLSLLKTHGYKRVSLSVQKANYAAEMYRKIGFDIVRENEEEWIMICNL